MILNTAITVPAASNVAPLIDQPLVFVLILCYESLDDTLACVQSVKQSDYRNFRLLVIDNASPDGSGYELGRHIPVSEFLQLPRNTGYAGGNNVGINRALEAGAEYVFILNPDVRVDTHTISACVSVAQSAIDIGGVNPIQLEQEGTTIDGKFFRTVLRQFGHDNRTYCETEWPDSLQTTELLGAALLLTRRALSEVGGFDPLYFAYGEETDLCRRLRYHHFRLTVAGNALVRHLRTKESTGVCDTVLFLRLKGIYLGQLKDPWRSFRLSIRVLIMQFWQDILGKRSNKYPFNQYPITRLHCIRAFFWVLFRLPIIRRHRRREQEGCAHV